MYTTCGELILASGSPRRREFLRLMGLQFTVRSIDIDETRRPGERPDLFVCRLAREKGEPVAAGNPSAWVVSGDTIVCLGTEIFGKPESEDHAVAMLMRLAGRSHHVLSAWSLLHRDRGISECRFSTTEVTFTDFSEKVARAYVATGEPMDKAGGYGLQQRGMALVARIDGSCSNVVGLPLAEVMAALVDHGAVRVSE